MVAEQLGRAAETLRVPGGPDGDAVHDARKRLKKARSAIRLGRADLGAAVARHANAELRRVGADLAEQRDADALVEVVDLLLARPADHPTAPATGPAPVPAAAVATSAAARPALDLPAEPEPADESSGPGGPRQPGAEAAGADADSVAAALGLVRVLLVARAEEAGRSLDRSTALGSARTLEQTTSWIDRVPSRADGWDAFGPGLAHEYRRSRAAFRSLPTEPTVDDLHEWRKRVKDVWYHQRLLRRLWTDAQRPIVAAADDLASTLGADHDLGLLIAHLAPAGERVPADLRTDAAEIEPLGVDDDVRRLTIAAARTHRAELQAHALRLGGLLLADRPSAWARRHGAWWAAAGDGPASPA